MFRLFSASGTALLKPCDCLTGKKRRVSLVIPNKPFATTPEFVNELTLGKPCGMRMVSREANGGTGG